MRSDAICRYLVLELSWIIGYPVDVQELLGGVGGNPLSSHWSWVLEHLRVVSLCDSVSCRLPGSLVHGILQARILEWRATPFFRESPWPRDQTRVSCTAGRFFNIWAAREAQEMHRVLLLIIWKKLETTKSSQVLCGKFFNQNIWVYLTIAINKIHVNMCGNIHIPKYIDAHIFMKTPTVGSFRLSLYTKFF